MEGVTLHSSWRGIGASIAGGLTVLGLGLLGFAAAGRVAVFPAVLVAAGTLFVLVTLLDYPVASTFTADGVERRMVLRRQFIAWGRVRQLTRTRPGLVGGLRKLTLGGLVAAVGRRRYLLVDQLESLPEFNAVIDVLGDDTAEALSLDTMTRPPEETNPTWLYRRHKWAPDSPGRR